MRLIDADGLFDKVGKIKPRSKEHYKSIEEFMNLITNSPTIDAIKVTYTITREDAIKILTDLIVNPFLHTWEEENKALHMAIEALSADVNSIKPQGDSISRSDAKDRAKEIIYSILDDTDYDDIESMAHACVMIKIKILKMFDEFPSADMVDMVNREDFKPVDNKLYLNPVCRSCKHEGYCNNIPVDENNKEIEYYDIYGRPDLSVRECKYYEPESD